MNYVGIARQGLLVGGDLTSLTKNSFGPPLAVNLEAASVKLLAESPLPRGEMVSFDEKPVCEDHALTAILPGPNGEPHASFAVVADGISQKMLHAERGSALAALAAFSVCKTLACDPDMSRKLDGVLANGNTVEIANFIVPLIESAWKRLIEADRRAISVERTARPDNYTAVGWSRKAYQMALIRDDVHSYGTTLLFAYYTGETGFVVKIGDGGVVELRNDGLVEARAGFGVKTSAAVDAFLVDQRRKGPEGEHYEAKLIGTPEIFLVSRDTKSLILLSDGPEESLALFEGQQRGSLASAVEDMAASPTREDGRRILHQLAKRPGAKIDDYSFAVAESPQTSFKGAKQPHSTPPSSVDHFTPSG